MDALYRAALGPVGVERYLPLFARYDANGRASAGWNGAASLCTLNWMVFRHLWTAALIYLAVALSLALLAFGIGRQWLQWPLGVETGVLVAIAFFAFAVPGLFGDAILHADVRKRIAAALAASRTVPQACTLLGQRASSRKRLQTLVLLNIVLALGTALVYLMLPRAPVQAVDTAPALTVAQAASAAAASTAEAPQVSPPPPATAQAPSAAQAPAQPADTPAVASDAARPAPPGTTAAAPTPTTPAPRDAASAAPATPSPGPAAALPALEAASAPAAGGINAAPPLQRAPSASAPVAPAAAAASSEPVAASRATAAKADAANRAATAPRAAAPARSRPSRAASAPEVAASDALPPPVGTTPGFYINVGLFAEESNARKAQARLLNEGFPAFRQELTGANGRRIRVRAGPYSTRAQADAAAASIRVMGLEAVVFKQ